MLRIGCCFHVGKQGLNESNVGIEDSFHNSHARGESVGDKISESHVDMGKKGEKKTYAEVTKEKLSKQVNETKAVRFIL